MDKRLGEWYQEAWRESRGALCWLIWCREFLKFVGYMENTLLKLSWLYFDRPGVFYAHLQFFSWTNIEERNGWKTYSMRKNILRFYIYSFFIEIKYSIGDFKKSTFNTYLNKYHKKTVRKSSIFLFNDFLFFVCCSVRDSWPSNLVEMMLVILF